MKDLSSELSKESHKNSKRLKQFRNKRPGSPALEDSYTDLHKSTIAIATARAGADPQ